MTPLRVKQVVDSKSFTWRNLGTLTSPIYAQNNIGGGSFNTPNKKISIGAVDDLLLMRMTVVVMTHYPIQ